LKAIVSDTSPLRALAKLDLLHLPSLLFDVLIIPSAVASELSVVVPGLPNVDPQTIPTARVQTPAEMEPLPALRARLGSGETEAIALALQLNATAILVDGAPDEGSLSSSASTRSGRWDRSPDRSIGTGD
jgi:predicted nucleic acid-binding protein